MNTATCALSTSQNEDPWPPICTAVAILGGGIAGSWLALKLAKRGVASLLITYQDHDRGGEQGAAIRSVGAINTSLFAKPDLEHYLAHLGMMQNHPCVAWYQESRVRAEIEELRQYIELKPIKIGVALANESGKALIKKLHAEYLALGGTILNGWVTRIVADSQGCRGVQYERNGRAGKVRAGFITIASGGYAGLFGGSIKTHCHGALLGRFLESGGVAENLEFIFKHGYGKPDMGELTPTEELPGAEIYDANGQHVAWLEQELFNGNGSSNHLQALKHWQKNTGTSFYVDLRYRALCQSIRALNEALRSGNSEKISTCEQQLRAMLHSPETDARVVEHVVAHSVLDFDAFTYLKTGYTPTEAGPIHKIRQIAYFSMGGIAHQALQTHLPNVFVCGEAMHDFGANRVGGLPWALYLVCGQILSDTFAARLNETTCCLPPDFSLVPGTAAFDAEILNSVRETLFEHHEAAFEPRASRGCIETFRAQRAQLRRRGLHMSDGHAWLLVAESILAASLLREESRGCFLRGDAQHRAQYFSPMRTQVRYDLRNDRALAYLTPAETHPSSTCRGAIS